MHYVLSLDLGTSSVRASLYDERANPVPNVTAHQAHTPDTTPDGGVEMDADALLERALECVDEVLRLAGHRSREIAGVGMCTFWHSILGVTGENKPASPVVLWADTRSVEEVEELKQRLDVRAVHARTGCVQHTSYVPSKLLWIHKHRPEWAKAAERWMSPAEYFQQRLFGNTACGVSMASGTGIYNHLTGDWDDEVLGALPINREQLNPIVDASHAFRGLTDEFARRFPALAEVPWFPACGDGASSNVGSGCTGPDRVALMVGTSGAVRVMRESTDPANEAPLPWGLWRYRWDRRRYLMGGALSNGGNLFAWMRDTLRVPEGPELERAIRETAPDAHGLTVLPFLAGERCPGWRGDARAAIVGLSWATHPQEILRAGLEAVAYRFALIHELLKPAATSGHRIIASGGALLASPAWTQMVADALGEEVVASEELEASARGAALLALEGTGQLPDLRETPLRLGRVFTPDPERHKVYTEARRRQAKLYKTLIEQDWSA
jgi:gluconokinase